MAYFHGSVYSENLGMATNVHAIIPQDGRKNKVLYLLHGICEDASAWPRYSRIECHAIERGWTVIMPDGARSFYLDMAYGANYFSYVTDELPGICANIFGIKHKREETFIAGLSMGGYGAMKCALSRPDVYGGGASFSGSLNMGKRLNQDNARWKKETCATYGEGGQFADGDNIFELIKKVGGLRPEERPRILLTCGASDGFLQESLTAAELLTQYGFVFKYMEWDGGHEWGFWDKSAQYAMDFFEGKLC